MNVSAEFVQDAWTHIEDANEKLQAFVATAEKLREEEKDGIVGNFVKYVKGNSLTVALEGGKFIASRKQIAEFLESKAKGEAEIREMMESLQENQSVLLQMQESLADGTATVIDDLNNHSFWNSYKEALEVSEMNQQNIADMAEKFKENIKTQEALLKKQVDLHQLKMEKQVRGVAGGMIAGTVASTVLGFAALNKAWEDLASIKHTHSLDSQRLEEIEKSIKDTDAEFAKLEGVDTSNPSTVFQVLRVNTKINTANSLIGNLKVTIGKSMTKLENIRDKSFFDGLTQVVNSAQNGYQTYHLWDCLSTPYRVGAVLATAAPLVLAAGNCKNYNSAGKALIPLRESLLALDGCTARTNAILEAIGALGGNPGNTKK